MRKYRKKSTKKYNLLITQIALIAAFTLKSLSGMQLEQAPNVFQHIKKIDGANCHFPIKFYSFLGLKDLLSLSFIFNKIDCEQIFKVLYENRFFDKPYELESGRPWRDNYIIKSTLLDLIKNSTRFSNDARSQIIKYFKTKFTKEKDAFVRYFFSRATKTQDVTNFYKRYLFQNRNNPMALETLFLPQCPFSFQGEEGDFLAESGISLIEQDKIDILYANVYNDSLPLNLYFIVVECLVKSLFRENFIKGKYRDRIKDLLEIASKRHYLHPYLYVKLDHSLSKLIDFKETSEGPWAFYVLSSTKTASSDEQLKKKRLFLQESAKGGYSKAQLEYAQILEKENHKAEAEEWYLMAANGGNSQAQVVSGIIFWRENKLNEAKKYFKKASHQYNYIAKFNLASILMGEGNVKEAKELLQPLELLKFRGDFHQNIIYSLGCFAYEQGNFEKATKYFQSVYFYSKDPLTEYTLGLIALEGRKEAIAKQYFKLSSEKGYKIATIALNYLSLKKNNLEEKKKLYEQLRQYQSHYLLGYFLERDCHINDAILSYKNSQSILAKYRLGRIYQEQNDIENSKIYYNKAAEQDHADAQYRLAVIYGNEGNKVLEEKFYQEAANNDHAQSRVALKKKQDVGQNLDEPEPHKKIKFKTM
jgi:TPR repeat protein